MPDPEYRFPQPSVTQALRIKTRQRRRGGLPRPRKPLLDLLRIVAWADEHHARTGVWPNVNSGAVFAAPGEKWQAIDLCLRRGHRGLSGGSSLARLFEQHRGVRNIKNLPPLTPEQILAWADAHHQSTGAWPIAASGPIAAAPGETWMAIDAALWSAGRGLPGGESLARLLAARRGVRNAADLPPLTELQLLAWADAHHRQTGRWPNGDSGAILGAPGEAWATVDHWLRAGGRGLTGGSSLARLLEAQRAVRNIGGLTPLTEAQILAWADAHYERTGRWPTRTGGSIPDTPGETWQAVNAALCHGNRGLPEGGSLAQLLAARRGVRNPKGLPPLSVGQILAWADAHHGRTGCWPQRNSGAIQEAPDETWAAINQFLGAGSRGLPGDTTLARLLAQRRGVRNPKALPRLTEAQVLAWADSHYRRTDRWPTLNSGPIEDAPGETWMAVQNALQHGGRGLRGGTTLARLLRAHRPDGPRAIVALPGEASRSARSTLPQFPKQTT